MLSKPWILAASTLLLLNSTGLNAADFQQGLSAYQRGDYKAAFRDWKPLADGGNSRAQKRLGDLYKTGSGVPQNYRMAADWYQRASVQGDATAQNALGVLYMNGQHVHQKFSEALRLFKLSAEQGNPDAMNNLGIMYTKGLGMSPDSHEAERWYEKAASLGHISAQHNLAFLRNYGADATQGACSAQETSSGGTPLFSSDTTGVTQLSCEVLGSSEDKAAPEPVTTPVVATQARTPTPASVVVPASSTATTVNTSATKTARNYRQLAEQGDADAQYQLAEFYLKGQGMPQDFVLAYTWFNLAASQGIQAAVDRRDELTRRMTPGQLEQGQGLSRDYYRQYITPFQ